MAEKRLMKGNEAMAEAAMRAGCRAYFGYPITPQNELSAYMARHMPDRGRVFIQAESEISAINMVYGAASTGARTMTSSSSPGMSLKQEGISYICGADLPCVIINVSRAGPGLGGISPAQGDYFQSTRGGGHGDYHHLVLAPKSVQEAADLTYECFDLAEKWRMPAMILVDGLIGQLMEAVSLPEEIDPAKVPPKPWAVGHQGATGRPVNHISSMNLNPPELERMVRERFERYDRIAAEEIRYEEVDCEEADLVLVAYGTSARVAMGVIGLARAEGIKLGLFRPISLWPFPEARVAALAEKGKRFLTIEMSMGQLAEDLRLAVGDGYHGAARGAAMGKALVHHYGRLGGVIPTEEEAFAFAKSVLAGTARPFGRRAPAFGSN